VDRDFISGLLVLVYMLIGTVGIALLVGWALRRFGGPCQAFRRPAVRVSDATQFSIVISRVQALLSSPRPVPRLRHVLVPVDFTESSLRALPCALFFARQFGCTATLLHVVHLNIVDKERGVSLTRYLSEMKSAAECTLECVAFSFNVPESRIVVRLGVPAVEVWREVADSDVDLVILGRHRRVGLRRVGLRRAFFSSIGGKIFSRAPCPSLVAG
jgi:nucleotide-binding universal stress UspA family protein